MGSIDKYIFRTTLASFALVLVSLTGVIWITQALRGIDLMTSQGQTIITFLGITSLERLPGGVLSGIFVDDRRDPKERVTIIADHGTVLKNENGSYLVLEDGNLERFEVAKRDPTLVAFGRYAFDMSKFSNQRDA